MGKYEIVRLLGRGGFARVYHAKDRVQGIDVALKVPFLPPEDESTDHLLAEVRVAAQLDHPNVLPILNADFVGEQLVIASPLGKETLGDRLTRRLSARRALEIAEPILEAVTHAHERRIVHCDLNPENVILFDDGRVRLADFGIAKTRARTHGMNGSGSGTVGYVAPEQAMGQLGFRADVFSLGVLLYRMLASELPAWPYKWPPKGIAKARRAVRPELLALLRRAMEVDHRRRFANATKMRDAYFRLGDVLR